MSLNKDIQEKTPVIRRQIVKEVTQGDFSTIALMFMAMYDATVACYLQESKRLGRPISVANIGAGDMWDLRVLIHGKKVKKSNVLHSYYAFDIEGRESPFGESLSEEIKFKSIAKDLIADPTLQLKQDRIDVVVCTEFIEHVDRNTGMLILKEMYRILRSGGLLYLSTPNSAVSTRSDKYHLYEWKLDEILEVMEGMGFKIGNVFGTYIDQKKFEKCNAVKHKISEELVDIFKSRFTSNFFRVVVAAPYPQYSNGLVIYARK